MKLRRRLLLAQAPLAIALLMAGMAFIGTVAELGKLAPAILRDNYRSVLAAQRMKEAIERIDSGAAFVALARRAQGLSQASANRAVFESELEVEERNITEQGERDAVLHLRAAWRSYQEQFQRYVAGDAPDLVGFYFDQMVPAFVEVKRNANVILDLNQDAMVHRSDRAARRAQASTTFVTWLAILALSAGVLTSTWLTGRLLRPLDSLASAVRQIAAGDLAARATVVGKDELAELAAEFNTMAEHIARYRQSSLGALLQAQQASQAAIDSLPDPVLVLDLDSNVTENNEAASRLLGLGAPVSGQHGLGSAPAELREAIVRARDHVLAGRGPYVPRGFEEAVRIPLSEGEVYLLPRATPLYGEEHEVEGVTVVLQDISKLRRFDELRNNLVATVAHEFRTPLTSLQMAIHLCVEQAAGPTTERQADLLCAARDDCNRLQTIVDELLNLARLQSGSLELKRDTHEPRDLVEEVIPAFARLAEQKAVELSVYEDPDLPKVSVDVERVKIALSNLVANAVRHSPEHAPVNVRLRRHGSGVRFEVADLGPGVPPEHREHVFDRFFRVPGARSGGAGLGLSIAREIVEAHGGTIGLESPHEEGGSVFWFTIPASAEHDI